MVIQVGAVEHDVLGERVSELPHHRRGSVFGVPGASSSDRVRALGVRVLEGDLYVVEPLSSLNYGMRCRPGSGEGTGHEAH